MKAFKLLSMCLVLCCVFAGSVSAIDVHGISLQKGAESPTEVGSLYLASYTIENDKDTGGGVGDTLEVYGLTDVVNAAGGNASSGNIIALLTWNLSGGATWDAINSKIILPPGGKAQSEPYGFYTVQPADFGLPGHVLPDQVTINWTDTCNTGSSNCFTRPETATASSATLVTAPLPCVEVDKTVDCDVAMAGGELVYTIEIENCGSDALNLVSVTDSLLGDITALAQAAGCNPLAGGATCTFNVNRTILDTDPDPLGNTVTVLYVDQYQQQATDSDSVSVDIIDPDFTVTKICTSQPIPVDGPATFEVVIENTGDVALEFTTNEAAMSNVPEPFAVSSGGTITLTIMKPATGSNVNNEITVSANVGTTLKCPIPDIVKTSNLATCYVLPTINVTKEASCNVAIPGNQITYTITIENQGSNALTLVSVIDSLLGNITAQAQAAGCNPLPGGATCSFNVVRTILPGDPDTLNNMVTATYIDAQQQEATDSDTAAVEVVHPNFTVTKTCDADPIPADSSSVTFTVVIQNTGDVDLAFTTNEAAQSSLAEPFTVLAGGTQNLTITMPNTGSDVENTITVTANVLLTVDPDCPIPAIEKTAGDTCHAPVGGITRTWGFWKTHTEFTKCIFDKCGSEFDLGWRVVDSYADVFGIFIAKNATNSDGSKRTSALCKAQVKCSHQALAALLNTCLDGGKPLPNGITADSIAETLATGTVAQINALHDVLGMYNESGDLEPLSPTETCPQGSATPKASTAAADLTFADCN
jgi:uncharacterized repeat protein (TIGR01451 family)